MDGSSSKSNSLSGEEWMDLSKSDYAKVIFSNLYWNSDSGTVGCHFKLTETVNKNPFDYIGLYKVGYDNISQCLASKKISELECESDAKLIHCLFKSEELPELNGFYQFLYVTQDKEVSGASMPFAAKNRDECSDDEVITEKVEDDFLMVRYGIEQKNDFLEIMIQRLQNEKLALTQELHLLTREKKEISSEYEATKLQLQTLLSEFGELKKEKEVLISDLETIKEEKTAVSCEFEVVKEKIISELAIITKSADDLSNELSTVKVERDNLYSDLEDCKNDKGAMISKLEQLMSQLKTAEGESNRLSSELEVCRRHNSTLASQVEKRFTELNALYAEKKENEAKLKEQKLNKIICNASTQLGTLDSDNELTKFQLKEAEVERKTALQLRFCAERKARMLGQELSDMKKYLEDKAELGNYSLWQAKEDGLKQIADLETMLRAMEDSKQLVINEMGEIANKLKETKEELTRVKCENILLKINLEDLNEKKLGSTSRNSEVKKESSEIKEEPCSTEPSGSQIIFAEAEKKCEQVKKQLDHSKSENEALILQMRFVQSQNINLESSIIELNKKLKEQEAKVVLLSKEKSEMQEELQVCQRKCEDKLPICKDLYFKLKERNTELEESNFEDELHNLIDQFETNCAKLHKLENECMEKDLKLEQLHEEIKRLKENEAAALNDVAEKTARLMEAAELYKELYIGKQKLLKKMNKILHNKSKSSLVKVLEDSYSDISTESDFLPLNIKTSKQSSSSNSDSDTGEHFCPQMTPLQVKELNFQTFVPEKETLSCLQQDSLIQCSENKTAVDERSLNRDEQKNETQRSENKTAVDEKPFNRDEQKNETQCSDSTKPESSAPNEKTFEIPCSVCEKLFSVSSTSNTPLLIHYEVEHKLDMCPVCGQLFEKCVPSKYLNIHINKHFESK